MFPKFHFLWNMGQYLWFLQCCGLCCFPHRVESGSGIVPTSLVAALTSTQARLYRVSCPMAEAQGKAPQHEGRVITELVGSVLAWLSSGCCPWKTSPSVSAVLL